MPRPPLKEFLEDPKHQSEREFLDGYFENLLERKRIETEKKRKETGDDSPDNIFDFLFGDWNRK